MFAALLIGSDRLGIGQALNPLWLFGLARANHAMSLRVALTYFVAAFVLGIAATVVGLVIPFAGLAVNLALPAIYALLVPALARFEVSRPPA